MNKLNLRSRFAVQQTIRAAISSLERRRMVSRPGAAPTVSRVPVARSA
jgi:hypothetical protein